MFHSAGPLSVVWLEAVRQYVELNEADCSQCVSVYDDEAAATSKQSNGAYQAKNSDRKRAR